MVDQDPLLQTIQTPWQSFVCDEVGIQGRLEGCTETALGAIFEAQNEDLKLGPSKGALPPCLGYTNPPDFALLTKSYAAKVLGEAKVPWNPEHDRGGLVYNFETRETEEPSNCAVHARAETEIWVLDNV
ncbi:hypothetical protein N7491_004766 [Penicillium cf. griseofulvum]|uniref:Uncharacterized protein n=1 Tax=Penicillium cf. griseofulvum TaxID=2972120 RepID=A0A9W9M3M2_9EURO|nr:hypothetical protein N7472_007455 [Penicillium cf. griseofulvum]KAJ5434171.1 hypothetical protein N7491_004766 [Penicillium cf. griseofulvum]KAJ5451997.1 hypothetical protein N7445_000180 [Penicillium cf. griseofulvum]